MSGHLGTTVCLAAMLGAHLGSQVAWAGQIAAPNDAGISMGHLHYVVEDVEANIDFWVRLGGEVTARGDETVIRFPDVLVVLEAGSSSGNSDGSVVNHMAFRVRSLDDVAAAGFELDRSSPGSGIANLYTPDGERIELFDNTATNLTFTPDRGRIDAVAARHNAPIEVPIVSHHLHLYLPVGTEREAQAWYARHFGGVAGTRWRYPAVDLPGINFNFSDRPEAKGPTQGRVLDHIGLEVVGLEKLCQHLTRQGIDLDEPYHIEPNGVGVAVLTDPWGTTIELTEGLRERQP